MKSRRILEAFGGTDPGCVRPNNEDNFLVEEDLGLFVVADGMGGHNSGEVASDLAATTIRRLARETLGKAAASPESVEAGRAPRACLLERFIKDANATIYKKGQAINKDAGMGTTVVAALADEKSMTVAHVGDSRAYLYRNGRLCALTEDHSLVGDQVRRGLLSAAEASKSSLQNILTRALGAEPDVDVDIADHELFPGDVVLLASDGLTKMVDDDDVARSIEEQGQPVRIVADLIAKAKAAGGIDNVTIIAFRVKPRPAKGALKGMIFKIFGSDKDA